MSQSTNSFATVHLPFTLTTVALVASETLTIGFVASDSTVTSNVNVEAFADESTANTFSVAPDSTTTLPFLKVTFAPEASLYDHLNHKLCLYLM